MTGPAPVPSGIRRTGATRRLRLRRRPTIALIVLVQTLLILGSVVWIGYRVYFVPPMTSRQDLRPADAIVVLGGTPYVRYETGIELAERGLAPRLIISNSIGADDPRMQELCDTRYQFSVYCFVPKPWTTRGEAQEIRRLAESENLHSLIVVTTTPHIMRARFIIERCFHGRLQMTNYPEAWRYNQDASGLIYQTAGWIRAFAQRGC